MIISHPLCLSEARERRASFSRKGWGTRDYLKDRERSLKPGAPGPLRIKKAAGTTNTVYVYSNGTPLAEYAPGALANSPSREYIYGGLGMLASISSGAITYFHPDHLSNRAETNATGSITRTLGTFPFGDSWYDSTPAEKWKFTTYERDTATGETGLDYAMARSYESGLARFTAPDPYPGSMDLLKPQSLNRYAYVINNPVNLTDPTGLDFGTGAPAGGLYGAAACTLFDGTEGEVFGCAGDPSSSFEGGFSFGVLGLGFGGLGGGFGIPLPGCLLPGACNIQLPTLSQEINSWLAAHSPWNNPCITSPISDMCGLVDNLVQDVPNPNNTFNCLPPGQAGPPAPGCVAPIPEEVKACDQAKFGAKYCGYRLAFCMFIKGPFGKAGKCGDDWLLCEKAVKELTPACKLPF